MKKSSLSSIKQVVQEHGLTLMDQGPSNPQAERELSERTIVPAQPED